MGDLEKLNPIHHIAINVADIEQAINWYRSSFTCQLLYQDKQQAILQFHNIKLVLVLPSKQQPHLAFSRDDADTLGELKEQTGEFKSTLIADPTGNLVEIVDQNSLEQEEYPLCE